MKKKKAKSEKFKLTFVIKSMMSPGGGAERVLSQVCTGLASRGHDISLITFDPPNGSSFYQIDDRIKVIRIGSAKPNKIRAIEAVKLLLRLRQKIAMLTPDAIISFMISSYFCAGTAATGLSCPIIACEHTIYSYYRNKPLQRLALNITPLICEKWIAVSEQAKNTFPRRLNRHMDIIPNPVPHKRQSLAVTSAPAGKKNILLTVGRLDQAKNHALLLEAFGKIHLHLPDWKIRIAGDGPLRATLEEHVKSLNLTEKVTFLGFVTDIDSQYKRAQAFAIPSIYESFGLVTAEALSYGLPVIGMADCEGTNQLVQHNKNGILVHPDASRVNCFSKELLRLLADNSLRKKLAKQAPNIENTNKIIEDVIEDWETLIGKLL